MVPAGISELSTRMARTSRDEWDLPDRRAAHSRHTSKVTRAQREREKPKRRVSGETRNYKQGPPGLQFRRKSLAPRAYRRGFVPDTSLVTSRIPAALKTRGSALVGSEEESWALGSAARGPVGRAGSREAAARRARCRADRSHLHLNVAQSSGSTPRPQAALGKPRALVTE